MQINKEYEIRLKAFVNSKIDAIIAHRGGDSYSWGYREAMEEVLKFLDDMVKIKEMLSKPTLPVC